MVLSILAQDKTSILMFFIAMSVFTCAPDPVVFDNPNHPGSLNYIGSSVVADTVIRIDLNSAELHWLITEVDENAEKFKIYKYQIENDSVQHLDELITLSADDVKDDSDVRFAWTDSDMQFETVYLYVIHSANSGGESKNSDSLDYYHGFFRTNLILEQTSDISVNIKISSMDPLADSLRYIWETGELNIRTVNLVPCSDFVSMKYPEGGNSLYDNHYYAEYYKEIDGEKLWVKIAELDQVLEFPQVSNCVAVRWNTEYSRISWRWNCEKVKPEWFIVKILKGGESFPSNVKVYNIEDVIQNILGDDYFLYYCEYYGKHDIQIIPYTTFHSGIPTDLVTVESLDDSLSDYYFVDESEVGQGFYISYCEVNNGIFSKWIQIQDDSVKSKIDLTQTDFNTNYTVKEGYNSFPARGIPYAMAEQFAQSQHAFIPNEMQWMLAASASTLNRIYPWGNDPPQSGQANFRSNRTRTINDTNFESGRVMVNRYYNILGAYHLAGNVSEWVNDSNFSRGLSKETYDWKNCKGGSYLSTMEEIKCDAETDFPNPVNTSDGTIGIRLAKNIP